MENEDIRVQVNTSKEFIPIDCDNIKTIEQVIYILKLLDISVLKDSEQYFWAKRVGLLPNEDDHSGLKNI